MNRLAKVQAISGLCFALFLVLHLATTVSAIGGPAAYDGVLAAFRTMYRAHPVVEILVIGLSGSIHITCAILRILERRRTGPHPKPPLLLRAHRWSGYFLALVIVGHVFATRVMPAVATGATATGRADFSYLAYSVLGWPVFINPYYFMLGLAGAIHLGLGLGYAAATLAPRRFGSPGARRASIAIATFAGALVVAGVASVIGRAGEADRSRFPEYEAVYDRLLPFMAPARSKMP